MENIDITLENPNVGDVNSVLSGPSGPAGFSPIATVSKTGNVATISITDENGTTTTQVTDGTNGTDGAPNTLTIGTVESGANASATITGDSPNQVLNLVLPKGDTGASGTDGFTPTITIGSVTTVSPDTPANVSNGGTNTAVILNFEIPQGQPGDTNNCLSVPTIVEELPVVGDPSKFYFVPKTFTPIVATGSNISETLTNGAARIANIKIEGNATQASVPGPISTVNGGITFELDGESASFNLGNIELCKIGTHKDYITKLSDGKWYLHKEIGKVNLEDQTWTATTGTIRGTTTIPNVKYASNNTEIGDALAVNYGVRQGQGLSNYLDYLAIDTAKVNVNTGSSANPTGILYYPYATPVETEIEDDNILDVLNLLTTTIVQGDTLTFDTTATNNPTITIDYYDFDIHNQYDKFVYLIDSSNFEQIG